MYVSRNQEEYFIASNLHHLISLIPFYGRNFYTVSQQQPTSNFIKHNQIYIYIRMLVLNITSNIVSIAATTAILSFQFYLIGIFMQHLVGPSNNNHNHNNLNNNNHPNPPETDLGSVGDVAASLFFLLSIQSGLSSLHAKLKIEKFFKNYSLLFIAILHFFHTQFDSQLMMLSASTKLNWRNQRNIRVLSLSSMLILIPIVILYVLFRNCSPSTWMLAASAFNIELMVKMSVSLFLYAIFTIDSMRTISSYKNKKKTDESDLKIEEENNQFSEHLDDYVYYVKAFGHIIEFLIGLVLFFNGAYILLFESYGAIRAIMMCIHAYYHIWLQARKGWSVFIKRRTAIKKLKCLEVFRRELFESEEEYERKKRDDVCAICFCELGAHESRITNCNHIFHFICLRKWLYLQDTCPMCHQKVYEPPKPQVNGQMQQPNQEQQDQN
jgi:E3 ubiquitin-protein ligase RNF139